MADITPTPTPTEEVTTVPIYAGVGIAICGNVMISLALNLQKYTHNKNNKAETNVHYLKRPLWWLGMILMLGGEGEPFSRCLCLFLFSLFFFLFFPFII